MYSLTKEKVPNLAENRQPDDNCPRVQLKKLIEECGTPKLSFEEIHNDDGSTTYLPIDSNNTKSKIMSKLDEFVKEYTGEDLKNSVLSDVNHYLTMVIEKEVRKRVRNEKKTEDLSLKVDAIDWENAVLSGKIDKLYVSQLDMYLSEVVGMSTKHIKAKGFTASKKRDFIKKHVLKNSDNRDDDPFAAKRDSNKLPTVGTFASSTNNNHGIINVIPWAGKITRQNQYIELVNTCPIDNFLMIFDYLVHYRKADINLLPKPLPIIFQDINKLLPNKQFGEAKMKWFGNVQFLPVIVNGQIDIFGNEHELFIKGIDKVLVNTVTSTCSEPNCPQRVIQLKSYSIDLGVLPRAQHITPQIYFRDSAMHWFQNNIISNCMRRSITGIVCTGTRNCFERIFDNGFLIILPFNADLLSKNGSIKSIQDLPLHLNFSVHGTIKRYEPLAVTFGSGTHFISAIKMSSPILNQSGWYLYDGIMEKRKPGTGLQLLPAVPNTPHSYRISYVVYLRQA